MLVSVLASGSKGNSTLIQTNKLNILIDCGMNLKYINNSLANYNIDLDDINYIFITHTHKDHIGALSTIIKKYKPYIFIGKKMLNDMDFMSTYDNIMYYEQFIELEDITVEIIPTSHDTTESYGFIFNEKEKSIVYITDTGYINSKYFSKLKNKNIYILESNHDIEKLMHGKYPDWLKRRVASDKGHLSNKFSSFYLSKFIGNNTLYIILAHLSHENNTEEIAYNTLKNTLNEYEIEFNNIYIAKQDEKTEDFII